MLLYCEGLNSHSCRKICISTARHYHGYMLIGAGSHLHIKIQYIIYNSRSGEGQWRGLDTAVLYMNRKINEVINNMRLLTANNNLICITLCIPLFSTRRWLEKATASVFVKLYLNIRIYKNICTFSFGVSR